MKKKPDPILTSCGPVSYTHLLSDRPNIKTVFLCLDSDEAGNDACSRLAAVSYTHLETVNAENFLALVKKYTDFSELTPAMINEFVEKILVHQAEGKGARCV